MTKRLRLLERMKVLAWMEVCAWHSRTPCLTKMLIVTSHTNANTSFSNYPTYKLDRNRPISQQRKKGSKHEITQEMTNIELTCRYCGGVLWTEEPRNPWRNSRMSSQQLAGTMHGRYSTCNKNTRYPKAEKWWLLQLIHLHHTEQGSNLLSLRRRVLH
jgi:hypothetical protein